jgi:hypothetical protein
MSEDCKDIFTSFLVVLALFYYYHLSHSINESSGYNNGM